MKIYDGHLQKLVLLRPYLFVGISMVTLERMQMGTREFMVVEDLEDVIWRGEIILEFVAAHILVVSYSLFTKRESHLVTYQSGENQIDYILVKRQNIKLVRDVKTIPSEECVTQHKLLVCDARIVKSEDRCKKFIPKRRVSKLQQADLRDKFCKTFASEINDTSDEQVDDIWSRLKQGLLSATEKTCGWTKKDIWRKRTW